MNLGDDLHTGQQAEGLIVAFEVLVFEFDLRFVVGGDGQATFLVDLLGAAADSIGGVCTEVRDFAFDQSVFLERERGDLDLGRGVGGDEAGVSVFDLHFGDQGLIGGDDGDEHRAGGDDGAGGMGGDFFDDAGLRGFEFEQGVSVELFFPIN